MAHLYKINQRIVFAVTCIFALLTARVAFAAITDIGASMQARQAISISDVQNIAVGEVDFLPVHEAVIQVGTDGEIKVVGSGLEISGGVSIGSVNISGDENSTIGISCETEGALANSDGESLPMNNTEISVTPVAFGSGSKCLGLGNVSLNVSGDAVVLLGAEITIAQSSLKEGFYDTALGNGAPITVEMVYQ